MPANTGWEARAPRSQLLGYVSIMDGHSSCIVCLGDDDAGTRVSTGGEHRGADLPRLRLLALHPGRPVGTRNSAAILLFHHATNWRAAAAQKSPESAGVFSGGDHLAEK